MWFEFMERFVHGDCSIRVAFHDFFIIHSLDADKRVDDDETVPHVSVNFFVFESSLELYQYFCRIDDL